MRSTQKVIELDDASLKKDLLKWLDKQSKEYEILSDSILENCESENEREKVTSHKNVFKFAALEEHLANIIIQTIDGSIA